MARADSTIRVNIIGDAKSLTRAADTAGATVGGLNKKMLAAGGLAAGGFLVAADAALEFGQTALKEADRVGDASGRLEAQLGDLATPLIDAADEFHKLGQSKGDMLDLEARIADIGTAAGIADDKLAPFAQSAAEIAAKMALATDTEADVWIDKIGKAAASGDMRSLRDLGINLSDAAVAAQALADTGKPTIDSLTDTEFAAARAELILADLQTRYGDVGVASSDLEQKQADLQAQMETLSGEIGEAVEGPLSDLLGFLLTGIEDVGILTDRLGDLGIGFDDVAGQIKSVLGPIGLFIDGMSEAIRLTREFLGLSGIGTGGSGLTGGAVGGAGSGIVKGANTTNVYVQGGSPEAIEQAVRKAVVTTARRG